MAQVSPAFTMSVWSLANPPVAIVHNQKRREAGGIATSAWQAQLPPPLSLPRQHQCRVHNGMQPALSDDENSRFRLLRICIPRNREVEVEVEMDTVRSTTRTRHLQPPRTLVSGPPPPPAQQERAQKTHSRPCGPTKPILPTTTT